MTQDINRCKKCNHLKSKHARPKHLRGFGDWDYYNTGEFGLCCVKNCKCNLNCFGNEEV